MISDADIDELASEFVLGALTPDERSATAARLRHDSKLAAAVAAWERRLTPLSHREPGIAPPPDALEGILARIAREAVRGRSAANLVALDRRARAWRWVATGMAATAAGLAIALGTLHVGPKEARPGTLVAVLVKGAVNAAADEPEVSTSPVFLATVDARSLRLTVRQVSGRRPPTGKAYALWVVEESEVRTTLLGVLASGGAATDFDLAGRSLESLSASSLLVSLETAQPGGAPKGPPVSMGKLGLASP